MQRRSANREGRQALPVTGLVRGLLWKVFAPTFIIVVIAAESASMASARYGDDQVGVGQELNITGAFSIAHTQPGVVGMNQTESSSPCHGWNSTDCVGNGGLSAGQWFLLVELRLMVSTKSEATYAVSVQVDSNGSSILQPIEFTITNSTAGSIGDFCWNLGPTLGMPFAYTVTVTEV